MNLQALKIHTYLTIYIFCLFALYLGEIFPEAIFPLLPFPKTLVL